MTKNLDTRNLKYMLDRPFKMRSIHIYIMVCQYTT
jgi:hypothetical protein